MIEKTCAILVTKPDAAPPEVSAKLEAAIRAGCCCFLSGLEYGAGLTAAEAVLRQREIRPGLTLECVIPYEEYTSVWDEPSRNRYFDILSRCERETMLMRRFAPDCIQRQREYLLRKSDIIIEI